MSFIRGAVCSMLITACSPAGHASDVVKVGLVGNISDAPIYIGQERGYFEQEGLTLQTSTFDSAARQIAPLATGELDVGGGAISAGLFNAAGRKIDLRIVADRSRMAPGYSYVTLMIRKDLVDSGQFKSLADLKGKKIALAAPAISPSTILNAAAEKGGSIDQGGVRRPWLGPFGKLQEGNQLVRPDGSPDEQE